MKIAPGPTALPFVGNLANIGLGKIAAELGPPPHRRLAQLAETYGDVMTVQMGREPWLVLSSPEAVHEAFVTKGSDFAGRPMVASMSLSAGGGKSGFARSLPGKELSELRRAAFGQLFSSSMADSARAELESEAELLAEHFVVDGARTELRTSLRR